MRLLVRGACYPLLVAWLCFAARAAAQADHGVDVHFISVGQADATLIRCADRYMLIDAGDSRYPDSAKDFKSYLQSHVKSSPKAKRAKLDVVVVSHAHTDHIGSMKWVLENYDVGTYVDGGDSAETKIWSDLSKLRGKLAKQGKLEYVNAKKAKAAELDFCPGSGVTLDLFSPWAYSKKLTDANDRSVVVRLGHGENSFLFVGDAHDNAEKVMLESLPDELKRKLDVDVLKVGHHGSDTSSTAAFVMAVSPAFALISSGRKETGTNTGYKHPRYSTLVTYTNWFKTASYKERYAKVRFPGGKVWAYDAQSSWRQIQRPDGIWLTTVDGTIIVRSDAKRLTVLGPADVVAPQP